MENEWERGLRCLYLLFETPQAAAVGIPFPYQQS